MCELSRIDVFRSRYFLQCLYQERNHATRRLSTETTQSTRCMRQQAPSALITRTDPSRSRHVQKRVSPFWPSYSSCPSWGSSWQQDSSRKLSTLWTGHFPPSTVKPMPSHALSALHSTPLIHKQWAELIQGWLSCPSSSHSP